MQRETRLFDQMGGDDPIRCATRRSSDNSPVADQVRSAIFEFTDTVIARMIPIGQMQRQSLRQ